jgi:hypothetical protein
VRHRVRSSSLPSFADCARRGASEAFRELIISAGFNLRTREKHVGALVGSGIHAAMNYTLTEKMLRGNLGDVVTAEMHAMQTIDAELMGSAIIWDDTTPNLNVAQRTAQKQIAVLRQTVAPVIEPVAVEEGGAGGLEANYGDILRITGKPDVREIDGIWDYKGGKKRANMAQYGNYSLLARTHGWKVEKLIEAHVPRVPLSRTQPQPELIAHDVAEAERYAASILRRVEIDLREFLRTNDPHAFIANPQSMLCSERFCTAWGTSFCRTHKGAV